MSLTHYKAITFDFWNTIYTDTREGFSRVTELRMQLLGRLARELGAHFTPQELRDAYQSGFQSYLAAWEAGRQFGAREQAGHVLKRLGVKAETDGNLDEAVRELEELGEQASLTLLPGALETIPRLAESGIGLGIISDTGVSPGRVLRRFLERDGLLGCFQTLTFSDETGYPKPDPRMFRLTLFRLGARPEDAAHVGDMPRTDVAGALAVGMKAIRMAARNDFDEPPEAHAVIRDHRDLARVLEDLPPLNPQQKGGRP
ncbi:MAG: HAD family hydrolase [Thermoleophilia bacterium]